MNKCVDCGKVVTWNKCSHICEECYDKELKLKIMNEERNQKQKYKRTIYALKKLKQKQLR